MEITIPVMPISAVEGSSSSINSTTNIPAVINAKKAAVAMLRARLINTLLSYNIFKLPYICYEGRPGFATIKKFALANWYAIVYTIQTAGTFSA